MAISIRYYKLSSAIAARICLHNANFYQLLSKFTSATLPKEINIGNDKSSRLILNYEGFQTTNMFTNQYSKHPRVFGVLIGLLIAFMSFTIVDPIRKLFVKYKLTSKTKSDRNAAENLLHYSYRIFKSVGLSSLVPKQKKIVELELPNNVEKRIEQYLKRDPDSILYLTGAGGTGKSQVARKSVSTFQPRNSLFLDFEDLLKITNEDEFIREFLRKIGFYPSFVAIETVGSLLDAITPGAGRAAITTPQSKIQKALKIFSDVMHSLAEKPESSIPLIVIDGFTDTNQVKNKPYVSEIINTLELWVNCKIARVIFVGDTTFEATGGLSSLIPSASVEKITLTDLDDETSLKKIRKELKVEIDDDEKKELENAIHIIGGRLGDISGFINRVNSGQTPSQAIFDIIESSKEEIKNILFEHKQSNRSFSTMQLWKILSIIAESKEITYDYILFSIFKGDDKSFRSLIETKLFTMQQKPKTSTDIIKASSPIMQRAFEEIYNDSLIRPGMDLYVARSSLTSEESLLKTYEEELVHIRNSGLYGEAQLANRIKYLLNKFNSSQEKIEEYDTIIQENTELLKKA